MPTSTLESKVVDVEAAATVPAASPPRASFAKRHRRSLAFGSILLAAGAGSVIAGIVWLTATVPTRSVWLVELQPGVSEFASLETQLSRTFTTHIDLAGGPRWHTIVRPWPGKIYHFVRTPSARFTYATTESMSEPKTECSIEPLDIADAVGVPSSTWRTAMMAVRSNLPATLELQSAREEDPIDANAEWLFEGCTHVASANVTSAALAGANGTTAVGRRLRSVNRVTGNSFADYAVDLELALRSVEESKLTASIHSILGTAASPGWALLTFTSYSVEREYNNYDTFNDPDVYAEIKTCDSGDGLTAWNGICHEYAYTPTMDNTRSAALERSTLIPLSTSSVSVKLWDSDVDWDDEIGYVSTAPFASCSASAMASGCALSFSLTRDVWGRWDSWWRYSWQPKVSATVHATLRTGASMDAKLAELNAAGTVVTEPRSVLLEPSGVGSYWSNIQYYASNVGYLLHGFFGDDPNVPVSGIWAYRLSGSHSGGQLKDGPGADTTSIFGWNLSVATMQALGPALASHDRYRRNELGIQIFNGVLWPEKHYHTIALGDDNLDHARTRPLLDLMVGPQMASAPATKLLIGQHTDALLAGGSLRTGNTITQWGTRLLHKFHLGLDIDQADAEEFVSKMTPFLATAASPSSSLAVGSSSLITWKTARLDKYEQALASKTVQWPTFSASERTRVASTVLDSLLFAGGLSVPSVIRNAFAVLYGQYGIDQLGANFELTESKLLPFVLETVRRFPPVSGFPSWDRRTSHHSVVDLLMASADADAWGADADRFVLRPMREYHTKSVMWADAAIVDGDNAHPYTHACPAKDLSIVMAVEFLRSFLRQGGKACWRADKRPDEITINGYSATELTLTDTCSSGSPPPSAPSAPCTSANSPLACPQAQMAPKAAACAAAVEPGAMRVGAAPLPESLRGVFWLTNQGDSSAVMSFARSNDGGGYSPGSVSSSASGGGSLVVRVGGDRVWSFMDRASSWSLVAALDLVYQFDFDSASAPTRAQITPTAPNIFGLELSAAWLLNFSMRLLPDGTHAKYPNSKVWARDTSVLLQDVPSAYYDLVQVVDAAGNKLQPAWNDFVAFCDTPAAGDTLGQLHYREASPMPDAVVAQGWWQSLLSTLDTRFDVYGRVVQKVLAGRTVGWVKPSATTVTVPTTMQVVEDVQIPLTDVRVPATDEHFGDVQEIITLAQSALGAASPFPLSGDNCGAWVDGEDKIGEIKRQIEHFPAHRSLYQWGDDRFSDSAITDLVFGGVGQHRIEPVGCAGCAVAPSSVPGTPKYAVLLSFAASLETRPGFAKLGADAFFDARGNVLAIVRDDKTWTPASNPGTDPVCTGFLFWRRCTKNVGWNHAKLAFRGTLMAVVTFVDHLYMLHFSVGNAIVRANVENVAPDHPLRRLLTPFGYRTEAINFQASFALVPENQLIHRASALTTEGIEGVFTYATDASRFVTWEKIRSRHKVAHVGVEDLKLPFYEDGDLYFGAVRDFVRSYLSIHYDYGSNTCGTDDGVVAWYNRVNSILPRQDLPTPITCEALEEVLATFMFYVSAMHNHVGTIAGEVEDPCFAPWAWREGELCGPPRTFFIQSLVMMSTSLEQPRILEDYTHMFENARDPLKEGASKDAWLAFTASLRTVGAEVARRNGDGSRRRPFLTFATERIETAISI